MHSFIAKLSKYLFYINPRTSLINKTAADILMALTVLTMTWYLVLLMLFPSPRTLFQQE